MAKDSAARIVLGRSFHQEGTFDVKVCESDFWYLTLSLQSCYTNMLLQTTLYVSVSSYPVAMLFVNAA